MSIWDNFVEDFNVAFHRKPGKKAEVVGPASKDYPLPLSYVENLDTVPVRVSATPTKKKAPKRANYDGMSFNDAFDAAKRAGKASFNWRGKSYTTQVDEGPAQPYVESIPMEIERRINEPYVERLWSPTAAMASYQADAGLANAALAPILPTAVPGIRGYGYGGCILPDIILY